VSHTRPSGGLTQIVLEMPVVLNGVDDGVLYADDPRLRFMGQPDGPRPVMTGLNRTTHQKTT
jgi:hypothetical protein